MSIFDLIVVGGGAAGFYGAIQAAVKNPGQRILILEKSGKLLSKVRFSGGGRCNVTHHCFDPVKLSRHYPRGEKSLRTVFKTYDARETVAWFESRGVKLKVEDDGRIFPASDSSETIIQCFLSEADRLKIRIETGEAVAAVVPQEGKFVVTTQAGTRYESLQILIATGGSPKRDAYAFIEALGHNIRPPLPSLFTFNDSEKKFSDLMGIAVPHAEVRIAGSKFKQEGAVLITHWGLSGPAVIKLSAWAAEYLHARNYRFTVLVSWIGPTNEDSARKQLQELKYASAKKKIHSNPLYGLPQRLWLRLCDLAGIPSEKIWGELGLKQLNKLLEYLIRCPFHINGKTTFKEEFVTCGGVDMSEVDMDTMESKKVKGVYFAGEVLNVDGETGGFNFQSAWSTAFVAAHSIANEK